MIAEFEVYMASLTWSGPDIVSEIKLSMVPLEILNNDTLIRRYETVIYSTLESRYCQLVIKSVHNVRYKNTGELLYRIPDSDIWIIKQDWRFARNGKGYHYCPSINTVGTIFFDILDISVEIGINNSFHDFDFNRLKDDFNGEFWHLLTSSQSKVHTSKRSGQAVLPINDLVHSFLNSFQHIITAPKKELKQVIQFKSIQRIKPTVKTFQKLAQYGLNSIVPLPSKAYIENIDLYENQYLCQMLVEIEKIVQYTDRYHEQRVKTLRIKRIDAEQAIDALEKPEILDIVKLQDELTTKRNAIIDLKLKWQEISNEIYNPSQYTPTEYTIRTKYKSNDKQSIYCLCDSVFCLINFPVVLAEHLSVDITYKCTMYLYEIEERIGKKGPYKVYNVYSLIKIVSPEIEKASHNFQSAKKNYNTLRINNWRADSIQSSLEKAKNAQNRRIQKNTILADINRIDEQITFHISALKESEVLREQLQKKTRSNFYSQISTSKLVKFRPSMTFIQNKNYKNAYQAYQDIKDTIGVDSDTLDCFGKLSDYTIRELPQVYELWCLVLIIRTLESFFGFESSKGDIVKLLSSIIPSEKKIERQVNISFDGNLAGRSINLYYQKQYKTSRKRPDILLKIKCKQRVIFLILDAKCKNYKTLEAAEQDMYDMVEKYKDKKSDRFVFTIHPLFESEISKINLTNLGGRAMHINNEVKYPFHHFGYMAAKPGKTDNLRKVISMGLEYLLEAEHSARRDDTLNPEPDYEPICINCGGTEFKIIPARKEIINSSYKVRYSYEYTCTNLICGHTLHVNYCWNCNTKLYKHGQYWDYHRTSIWSAMDIHCPCCGLTTADMNRTNNE